MPFTTGAPDVPAHASDPDPSGVRPSSAQAGGTHPVVADVLRLGRLLAVVAGLTLLVVHLANAFIHGVSPLLDANLEGTVWTWASVLATGAIAMGALLGSVVLPRQRYAFLALAALTAFLSVDDLTAIHERVTARLIQVTGMPDTLDSVLWPVLYLPVLAGTALLLYRFGRDGSPEMRRMVLYGLGLLALALMGEIVSAPWSDPNNANNAVHDLEGGFEEGLELAGWTLLATALVARVLQGLVRGEGTPAGGPAVSFGAQGGDGFASDETGIPSGTRRFRPSGARAPANSGSETHEPA